MESFQCLSAILFFSEYKSIGVFQNINKTPSGKLEKNASVLKVWINIYLEKAIITIIYKELTNGNIYLGFVKICSKYSKAYKIYIYNRYCRNDGCYHINNLITDIIILWLKWWILYLPKSRRKYFIGIFCFTSKPEPPGLTDTR